MRVKDEAFWQQCRADVLGDGSETGKAFLKFTEDWATSAEELRDYVVQDPAGALRDQLQFAEARHGGRVDAIYLAQMMAVLSMHWVHGEEMVADLTPIERRLVEDVTLLKIRHAMAEAEETTGG